MSNKLYKVTNMSLEETKEKLAVKRDEKKVELEEKKNRQKLTVKKDY